MPTTETISVDNPHFSCDGGNNELGHPRIYLTIKDQKIDCPYCGRHYVLSVNTKKAAAH